MTEKIVQSAVVKKDVDSDSDGSDSVGWFKKYFWEGQKLQDEVRPEPSHWIFKHRRLVAILVPMLIVQTTWIIYMSVNNLYYLFTDTVEGIPRYYMSITMVFGSMIAGATSEGGASVAFPVMTLAFGIAPSIARDFSFMIQSVGMTAASFSILWMRVQVEFHSLIYCSIGGIGGIIFGLERVAPRLAPPYSKMYFVCIWFAFAFSLFWLNRTINRKVYTVIPDWKHGILFKFKFFEINWKAIALLAAGFLGGIFSAIAGSGIDICSFATLTLLFRVTEKTATPTSVVLMGLNTVVGFLWRNFGMGGVETAAWGFLAVCAPIVVVGAPLGSIIGSHLHRLVLASFVYVTDTVQLIGAIVVVKPWKGGSGRGRENPTHLMATSAVIIFSGAVFFFALTRVGLFLMQKVEARQEYNKIESIRVEKTTSTQDSDADEKQTKK